MSAAIIKFVRPRIEPAPEGGWFVHLPKGSWLCGDRHQALSEFKLFVRIERTGSWRSGARGSA